MSERVNMKNNGVWFILLVIGCFVGFMAFNNYRQSRMVFDDFDDVGENYNYAVNDEIIEIEKEEKVEIKENTVVVKNDVNNSSVSTGVFVAKKVNQCSDLGNLDCLVAKRVNEIRKTSNTNISGRKGKVYYVSASGNDSNSGLSASSPLKTLEAVTKLSYNGKIPEGSTILLRDGDTFRGKLSIYTNNILIGSYGDISKGKPVITRSVANAAKEGVWIEVKPNIWKYQLNGSDKLSYDVGVVWFFCDSNNKNCSNSMNTIDKKFMYSSRVVTTNSYSEDNIESKIDSLLTKDLQHYYTGHNAGGGVGVGTLYLYSKGNPASRFNEIEFAAGGHAIRFNEPNGYVDNIKILFAGAHGISAGTMSNLIVTNSEFGFIGGTVHHVEENSATRFGNAIEIYGSVMDRKTSKVTDGFIVKNNYIYQVYDAGATFQLSNNGVAHMEKADFNNNVIEYSNYNIEYWMYSSSTDKTITNNSYIKNFTIQNNIFRNAGVGVSETRPDKGCSAHIKTWNRENTYNIVKGSFEIKNNIFGYAKEQYIYLKSSYYSNLPKFTNNTFYGKSTDLFGYYFGQDLNNKKKLYFDNTILNEYFSNNNFVTTDAKSTIDSGKSGSVNWLFDSNSGVLKITGAGAMQDYTDTNLPPWNKYKNNIYTIVIDEGITKIGNYAFYNLTRVTEIRINSKKLADFPGNSNDGTNYIMYHVGVDGVGAKLVFGPNVTYIPGMLMKPTKDGKDAPFITKVVFEGNKITEIGKYGLAHLNVTELKIPNSVKKINGLSIGRNKLLKFLVVSNIDSVSGWTLAENMMEKAVFGNVSKIKDATFRRNTNLTTLVISHIADPSYVAEATFQDVTKTVNIYGDESVKTWVNNLKKLTNQTNLVYHSLSDYKITVKSNTGINTTVKYDGSYTFETNKNVSIKMYYDSEGKRYSVDVDYTKNGNKYTINNIKSDIYIEVK